MSKGYWIGRVDVSNLDAYQNYITANARLFAKYGTRFLVRGGSHEVVEGTSRQQNVVIEFESYQAALDCYHSSEYEAAKALRLPPVAEGDLIIIEGYGGPQPE